MEPWRLQENARLTSSDSRWRQCTVQARQRPTGCLESQDGKDLWLIYFKDCTIRNKAGVKRTWCYCGCLLQYCCFWYVCPHHIWHTIKPFALVHVVNNTTSTHWPQMSEARESHKHTTPKFLIEGHLWSSCLWGDEVSNCSDWRYV